MPNHSRASFSRRERELRSQLHLLLNNAEGFIHGSLIEMARKCGNPNCRCASNDDHKHRSRYLGQTRDGKTSMIYLSRDLEPQVSQAIDHFQRAISLLEELNVEMRLRLAKNKRKPSSSKKKTTTKKKTARKKASARKRKPH